MRCSLESRIKLAGPLILRRAPFFMAIPSVAFSGREISCLAKAWPMRRPLASAILLVSEIVAMGVDDGGGEEVNSTEAPLLEFSE